MLFLEIVPQPVLLQFVRRSQVHLFRYESPTSMTLIQLTWLAWCISLPTSLAWNECVWARGLVLFNNFLETCAPWIMYLPFCM